MIQKALELSRNFWKAMHEEDTEFLKETIDEKAVFVHMGAVFNKEEECNVVNERGIVYQDIDIQDVSARQIQSTVIVLTKMKLTAVVGGNEVTNPFMVTEVYVQQNDDLKLASLSFTKTLD